MLELCWKYGISSVSSTQCTIFHNIVINTSLSEKISCRLRECNKTYITGDFIADCMVVPSSKFIPSISLYIHFPSFNYNQFPLKLLFRYELLQQHYVSSVNLCGLSKQLSEVGKYIVWNLHSVSAFGVCCKSRTHCKVALKWHFTLCWIFSLSWYIYELQYKCASLNCFRLDQNEVRINGK